MTAFSPVVGVDACPAGWVATALDGTGARIETYDDFETLAAAHAGAERILVDIPIGLPTTSRRRCDEEASDRLGCRGISVFYPPSAAAVECDDYETASETHRDDVGHGLSRQAFHIGAKIRDVARVVDDDYAGRIREAHPELCFAALNGQPIAYAKSSERGRRLRRSLLRAAFDDASFDVDGDGDTDADGDTDGDADADTIYEDARDRFPLSAVGRDDLLDSMVLAVAAAGPPLSSASLATVPEDPAAGEPRIYYPAFELP
ncbi:DUF429 domain-containing protein [Halobellus sp. Atlit-31R]|nr:DUF429 domain-containing protein [Halobellus sp. Atlit-31R]